MDREHASSIGDLSKRLDARSRFQAGWLAALRLSGKASIDLPKPR